MIGEAEYADFRDALLEQEEDGGWFPVLRFSQPFSHWGAHEGLEATEKAINDLNLETPNSALQLRKLHLLRALLKQCLAHGFMAPGEPPAEPEPEPKAFDPDSDEPSMWPEEREDGWLDTEDKVCTSAATIAQAEDTELSESAELSESDTPSPFLREDQSAESADER